MLRSLFARFRKSDAPRMADEGVWTQDGSSVGVLTTRQVLERAAALLARPGSSLQLTPKEARIVTSYMHAARFREGTRFIEEGNESTSGFILLVVEGDVVVESFVVHRREPITLKVLGPGSIHGEVGLLDGLPRSASCTAGTDLAGAVLTRDGLHKLLRQHPEICAKLLIAMGINMAARMRENAATLKSYAQLTRALQDEIDQKYPTD